MAETDEVMSESVLSGLPPKVDGKIVSESDNEYPEDEEEEFIPYIDKAEQIRLEVLKQFIKEEMIREKSGKKSKKVKEEDGIERKPSSRSVKWKEDEEEEGYEEEGEEDDQSVEEEEEVCRTPPSRPMKKQKCAPPAPPKRVVKKRSVSSDVGHSTIQGKKLVFV